MYSKKIFIYLILFLCSGLVKGQTIDSGCEIISYKDGSYFKGYTIDQDENHIVFDLFNMADTLLLEKSLIDEIGSLGSLYLFPNGKYHRRDGLLYSASIHYGGRQFDNTMQIELSAYQVYPKIALGFGIAFNATQIEEVHWQNVHDFAEVFMYTKYFINNKQRRFFIDGKLGAAIALGIMDVSRYTTGPIVQPGIGFEFASNRNGRFTFHLRRSIHFTTVGTWLSSESFKGGNLLLSKTTVGVGWNFQM